MALVARNPAYVACKKNKSACSPVADPEGVQGVCLNTIPRF